MRGCLLTRGCSLREARGAPRASHAERAHALVRALYPTFARQAGGFRKGARAVRSCAAARPHFVARRHACSWLPVSLQAIWRGKRGLALKQAARQAEQQASDGAASK